GGALTPGRHQQALAYRQAPGVDIRVEALQALQGHASAARQLAQGVATLNTDPAAETGGLGRIPRRPLRLLRGAAGQRQQQDDQNRESRSSFWCQSVLIHVWKRSLSLALSW